MPWIVSISMDYYLNVTAIFIRWRHNKSYGFLDIQLTKHTYNTGWRAIFLLIIDNRNSLETENEIETNQNPNQNT